MLRLCSFRILWLQVTLHLIEVHLEHVETFPRSHELKYPMASLGLTGRQKGLPCSVVYLPSGLSECKQQLHGQKSPSNEELHFCSSLFWMDPAHTSLLLTLSGLMPQTLILSVSNRNHHSSVSFLSLHIL